MVLKLGWGWMMELEGGRESSVPCEEEQAEAEAEARRGEARRASPLAPFQTDFRGPPS